MSRMQNILEKAEREGAVRRVVTLPEPPAGATLVPGEPIPAFVAPPVVVVTAPAATAVPSPATPPRAVSGTALNSRLVTAHSPASRAAEQYRSLRTRIIHADQVGPVHVVLITSPWRGEGKSLTAANLSLTMAQEYQRRICVVDADLRAPQLRALFGLPEGPGLTDVLTGRASLEDALVTLPEYNLTILPAGTAVEDPAELLGTTTMRRTIDTLRSQFDRVVMDTPAATPLADVSVLTSLVDSVVLVVKAGVTSRPAIQDAVAAIDASKLLGVVLNQTAA
jgi:protein-tyrosine kinase